MMETLTVSAAKAEAHPSPMRSAVSTRLRDYAFGSSAESESPAEDWLPKDEAQVMGVHYDARTSGPVQVPRNSAFVLK